MSKAAAKQGSEREAIRPAVFATGDAVNVAAHFEQAAEPQLGN
jgi:hypothetical protein